jgi:Domain of unknown function (DUF4214)
MADPEHPTDPGSVEALLALADADFVRAAYRTVLGRQADPTGLAHYVDCVRRGADKTVLVADLARSNEGRQRTQTLAGLAALLASVPDGPPPLATRVLNRVLRRMGAPALVASETRLRAIENQLARMEAHAAAQTAALARALEELTQMGVTLSSLREERGFVGDGAGSPRTPQRPRPPQVRALVEGLQRMRERKG